VAILRGLLNPPKRPFANGRQLTKLPTIDKRTDTVFSAGPLGSDSSLETAFDEGKIRQPVLVLINHHRLIFAPGCSGNFQSGRQLRSAPNRPRVLQGPLDTVFFPAAAPLLRFVQTLGR